MKQLITNFWEKGAGLKILGNPIEQRWYFTPEIAVSLFQFLDNILIAHGVIGIRERIFSFLKVLIFPAVPVLPLFFLMSRFYFDSRCAAFLQLTGAVTNLYVCELNIPLYAGGVCCPPPASQVLSYSFLFRSV